MDHGVQLAQVHNRCSRCGISLHCLLDLLQFIPNVMRYNTKSHEYMHLCNIIRTKQHHDTRKSITIPANSDIHMTTKNRKSHGKYRRVSLSFLL